MKIDIYIGHTILFIFSIFSVLFAQEQPNTKVIDSLLIYRANDTTEAPYYKYKTALEISKHIGDKRRELKSYFRLMYYFGNKKNLDSMMHYAYYFENSEYQNKYRNLAYFYYYYKANSLVYNFEMIEQSLLELEKAYSYSDESNMIDGIRIKTNLAYSYISKKQYDKAIETLKPYTPDSIKVTPRVKLSLLSTLAQAYQCKKDGKNSYPLNLKTLKIAKQLKDTTKIFFIKSFLVHDYHLQGKHNKAIDSGLQIINHLKKHNPVMLQANYYNLSLAYDAIDQTDKAIFYMNEAIAPKKGLYEAMSDHNLEESLDYLAKFYTKNKKYKRANLTLCQKSDIISNARAKEQKAFTDYYDVKIRIIDQEKEKEKIQSEKKILTLQNNKQKQYILMLSIGFTCLLLIFSILWVYSKYFKSKEKIKALENKEREILKNHIQVRETELSMLATNKAKLLSELSEIKKELSGAIKENDKSKIHTIEKDMNSFLVKLANDNVFSKRLESQYPDMVMVLKDLHPQLSQNDIRHCILIKLGLSLKESAQLMHVGIGAIKMGRNRARTKINLPAETTTLKQYLDKISEDALIYDKE